MLVIIIDSQFHSITNVKFIFKVLMITEIFSKTPENFLPLIFLHFGRVLNVQCNQLFIKITD